MPGSVRRGLDDSCARRRNAQLLIIPANFVGCHGRNITQIGGNAMASSANDPLSRVRELFAEKYEILGILGQGGTATVYLARDPRHSRRVAIKVLDSALTDAIGGQRFLREIETAAGLVHPHILTVHDSGSVGGLLYYVMPHIAGESLRDRIRRLGRLNPTEALRIARDVGDALAYAHVRGVIHRDIKPGNILLAEGGHAWVADFGIARALVPVDGSVTSSGLFVGTPLYMSPEQATADGDVDERSDLYSLGCVLYEMVTGKPPFAGPVHVVLAAKSQGLANAAGPLEAAVSSEFSSVIRKGLRTSPEERYSTARAFVEALSTVAETPPYGRAGPLSAISGRLGLQRWTTKQTAGIVALLASIVILLGLGLNAMQSASLPAPSPSRYLIAPFDNSTALEVPSGLDLSFVRALEQWRDIQVVELPDANPQERSDIEAMRGRARQLGASRFIAGEYLGPSSRLRLRVVLHDVASREPIAEATASLVGTSDPAVVIDDIVDRLLFPEKLLLQQTAALGNPGTSYSSAWRAHLIGLADAERLDLVKADSAFRIAISIDPDFSNAHFWIAQIALWLGQPLTVVEASAARALRDGEGLPAREQMLARATWLMGRAEFPAACARYDSLTQSYPFDFAPWYGMGECTRRDSVVIRDSLGSPSGWSFRSSLHQSTSAYRQAFLLLRSPAGSDAAGLRVLSGFRDHDFRRVQEVLFTAAGRLRPGHSLPGREQFYASASWRGDTLAFIPYPAEDIFAGRSWTVSPTAFAATENQRRVFRSIAAAWSQTFPGSVDAQEAVAVSLELLGDASAIDTIVSSRGLAADRADRDRLAVREALLRFKFSVPDRTDGLQRAAELTDSLLRAYESQPAPPALAWALASLRGRPDLAVRAARQASFQFTGIPVPYRGEAAALLAYSALGEPIDSIRSAEQRLERAVRSSGSPESMDSVRYLALGQAAALALPVYAFDLIRDGAAGHDYQLSLGAALLRFDTLYIRTELNRIRDVRRSLRPADLTMDALLVEAWILAQIGDVQDAIDWLDPTLEALRFQQPWEIDNAAIQLASIMRAIELRATLARRVGDTDSAERWSRAYRLVR
jgi:serine/threonine protein kinase